MTITSAFGNWNIRWPLPRIHFLKNKILGFTYTDEEELYAFEMYYNKGNWSAVFVKNLGYVDRIKQISIADFGPYYMLAVMYIDIDESYYIRNYVRDISIVPYWGLQVEALVDISYNNQPLLGTICNYNAQIVGGAVDSNAYPWDSLGMNTILWSGIGNLEFNPSIDPTAGFTNVEWKSNYALGEGMILRVLQLGSTIVAYGEGGIEILSPYSSDYSSHTRSSAPMKKGSLSTLGIQSGNHVAGNNTIHGFVDFENRFCTITEKEGVQRLGYKEYLDPIMASEDVLVNYNPRLNTFYVSNGERCFVYNGVGGYTTNQCITSLGYTNDGTLFGFYVDNEDTQGRIVTQEMDLGIRGIKTVQSVEASISTDGNTYTAIDYKYNKGSSFTRSPWIYQSPEGISSVAFAGIEHRVGVASDDYTSMKISDLNIHFKVVDRRFLHGPIGRNVEDITERGVN